MTDTHDSRYPIPEGLNIAIFVAMHLSIWGLLWLASHSSLGWMLLGGSSASCSILSACFIRHICLPMVMILFA